MEEALQPPATDQQVKQNKYFAFGIAASVVLHLICTVLMLGVPAGSRTSQSITYVDLSLPHAPAPAITAPVSKPAPEVAAEPERPLVPEKPLPPAAEPQQAQQPTTQLEQTVATPEKKVQEQRSATTFGMGLTKGYFKSLGEGETLREGVKGYYLDMLQRINEKWWLDQQFDNKRIDPIVLSMTLARNGAIVDIRILRSSGNPRYDKAVLAALNAAGPLPPLPSSFQEDFFVAPIRLVPPLNLMAW